MFRRGVFFLSPAGTVKWPRCGVVVSPQATPKRRLRSLSRHRGRRHYKVKPVKVTYVKTSGSFQRLLQVRVRSGNYRVKFTLREFHF